MLFAIKEPHRSKVMKTRYANLILSLDFTCGNQLQQTLHVCWFRQVCVSCNLLSLISTTKQFFVVTVTVSCCTIKYLLHRNNFQEDRFREFRHNAQHCKPSLLSPLIQIKHGFMLDWNAGIYKGVAFCYLSISGKRLHINHFRCSKLTFLCSIMMKKY